MSASTLELNRETHPDVTLPLSKIKLSKPGRALLEDASLTLSLAPETESRDK